MDDKDCPYSVYSAYLADEELDAVPRPIYYETFPGAKALWEGLPKGAASLARVRDWVRSQEVEELYIKPPEPVYARFNETRPNRLHQADLMVCPMTAGAG